MIHKFTKSAFLILILILFSERAFAHGMDKPGPHGGYIRMPGAFHTELVLVKPSTLKVYLLDINFKFPTIKESSVSALFVQDGKTTILTCSTKKDYFECNAPNVEFNESGSLKITANRMKNKGVEAVYELPLKFKK